MTKTTLINAKEVAEILGTSKFHAYKVVQQLNEEPRTQGYIVIAGKVSRTYFKEKQMNNIKSTDVMAWKNAMMNYRDGKGKGYSVTYIVVVYKILPKFFKRRIF